MHSSKPILRALPFLFLGDTPLMDIDQMEDKLEDIQDKIGRKEEDLVETEDGRLTEQNIQTLLDMLETSLDKEEILSELKEREIKYEEEFDLMYMEFKPIEENGIQHTIALEGIAEELEGIHIDIDTEGKVAGIEVLEASQVFPEYWISLVKLIEKL